jgi:hypothetical protein
MIDHIIESVMVGVVVAVVVGYSLFALMCTIRLIGG